MMTPTIQAFVMHFGEMGSRWGINRTVAQMYALLVTSADPINADGIAQTLGVSRGNVSMGLKELQAWRLIKPQHQPGDRKEYYTAAGDVWDMGVKVLEERRKREIDPTLTVLRDLLLSDTSEPRDEHAKQKIQEMHDLLELVSNWSLDLQKMQPDNLRTLMKLGSGVGKVLSMKDKLLSSKSNTDNE